MDHKITGSSGKDGQPWWDSKGREWQRWWCGNSHETGSGKCRVSIPKLTGKKR
jgi:hypothetical protein